MSAIQTPDGEVPVLIVMIDGHAAIVDRLSDGRLTRQFVIEGEVAHGEADHMGDAPAQHQHAGTRGRTASEAADIARQTVRRRLVAEALARVVASAPSAGWIVVGGTSALATRLHRALPDHLRARAVVGRGLQPRLPATEIVERTTAAVRALRRSVDAAAVQSLLERSGAHTTGVVGAMAALDAAEHGAVDTLYVTPAFVDRYAADAARAAECALDHGGRVHQVDGDAASRLDAEAGGIGAALRYALHAAPR